MVPISTQMPNSGTGDGIQSNIKVVFDEEMNALYMSRTPIPYPFKSIDYDCYRHVRD